MILSMETHSLLKKKKAKKKGYCREQHYSIKKILKWHSGTKSKVYDLSILMWDTLRAKHPDSIYVILMTKKLMSLLCTQ